jgi:amidohydrolase
MPEKNGNNRMAKSTDQIANLYPAIVLDAEGQKASLVSLRRKLHRYPEIGYQEYKTTAVLKRELSRLGLAVIDGRTETGLWAQLDTGSDGPVIAMRTDIDALPVSEQTELPFTSKRPGFMHACGHDIHMTVLVGTARLLIRRKEELHGRVRFICQPAEEIPPGGARLLIDAGVLKNPGVDAILALHVDPNLPVGSIGLRDGPGMASVYDFDLRIVGKSGHAALPHKTVDAVAVAAEVVSGLQQVISRMTDPIEPAAITFGTIKGGIARNVIAGEVTLQGTARSLNPALARKLPGVISRTARHIAQALGARAEIKPIADYPVLKSDARVNRFISRSFRTLYPDGRIHDLPPVLGGEDFAYYLLHVPGAMFRLGVGNKRIGADKPWHHPAFAADEDAIPVGVATMTATIINMLFNWNGGPE